MIRTFQNSKRYNRNILEEEVGIFMSDNPHLMQTISSQASRVTEEGSETTDLEVIQDHEPSILNKLGQDGDMVRTLQRCKDLSRNDSEMRNLLLDLYSKGLTVSEISQVTCIPRSTIYTRLRKGGNVFRQAARRFNDISLSVEESSIVLGTVLGDGCLHSQSSSTSSLMVFHCAAQKEYIEWKYSLIPTLHTSYGIRNSNQQGYASLYFTTRSCVQLGALHSELYIPEKMVNVSILQRLGSLGLAVWFMDDGSKRGRNLNITVPAGWADEVVCFFRTSFDFDPRVYSYKYTTANTIAFTVSDSLKLCEEIYPHIIPEMQYKLIS